MNRKYKVGIIGATGMVGQRFITLLEEHPWFELTRLAASGRSAGKPYAQTVEGRWKMSAPIPEKAAGMTVYDASDVAAVADGLDFVFCAVDMDKHAVQELEEAYAKHECPVVSNNSACRWVDDVPMILPEINPEHADVIPAQRKRLGTRRGFIAVKPNCSIQSYVPALNPLRSFGIKEIAVCTYQAISGAGKTFDTMPQIIDNVIPYIGGEEEKSEREPLKIWGSIQDGKIVTAAEPVITAQCIRVPVSDGHLAAAFVKFENKPTPEQMKQAWAEYKGDPQRLGLPSAPKQFLTYFEEPDFPQTKLHRDLEGGMGVSIGRLRDDAIFDYRFISISHNTLRGAAGGAVLMAELLAAKGWFE